MDHLDFLFAGFAIFWGGLFLYMLWLQMRLRTVSQELERLEERLADEETVEQAATAATTTPESQSARG